MVTGWGEKYVRYVIAGWKREIFVRDVNAGLRTLFISMRISI
ncbi:hypothetical protein AALB16_05360 [Lachnospiraceae bacterium 62-35]